MRRGDLRVHGVNLPLRRVKLCLRRGNLRLRCRDRVLVAGGGALDGGLRQSAGGERGRHRANENGTRDAHHRATGSDSS